MSSVPQHSAPDPRDAYFDVSSLDAGLAQKTGRSAFVILVFSVLRLLITLVTTAIIARFVPPEEQGKVAIVLPVVMIAAGLSEFGLPQAVIQQKQITHRVVSALFWINIALGLSLTVVAAGLAPVATAFYDSPDALPILLALSPYVLITVATVHYVAILRRRMEIRTAEICSFAGVIISAVMAVIAAIAGLGAWTLVIQMLAAQAISLVCFMVAVRWRPSWPWHADFWAARGALAFGGYLSLDRLLNEIVTNLQTVLIGRAFGTAAAGLYFRANTFADMPRRRFVSPLAGAFVPSLSRLQDDPDALRAMYIRQVSRANLIMVPVGLMICLSADMIVLILLGSTWMMAVPILTWLGTRPLMAMLENANTWVMVAMGKPKALFQARCLSAVFLVGALIGAIQFDMVTFVAIFVLAQIVVTFAYMPYVITKQTPITWATIRQAIEADVIFGIVIIAIGLGLRAGLTLSPYVEGLCIGALVSAAQGGRIMLTPQYRYDIMRLRRR